MPAHLKLPSLLLLITVLAILLRIPAFFFNDLPHADVNLDEAAAWGLLTQGKLVMPFVAPRPYPSAQFGFGYPLDQHAPLWPVLGAAGSLVMGNIYLAFKLLSLLAGSALIPASYFALRSFFGERPALLTSVFIALTYVLIDYSGNGSLYSLHALLFVLFIWCAARPDRWLNALLLGVLAGLAYLLNYQAVVLVPVLLGLYFFRRSAGNLLTRSKPLWIALAGFLVVITPWLVRNTLVFGSPLYNTNLGFVYSALNVPSRLVQVNGSLVIQQQWGEYNFTSAPGLVVRWIIRNLGYFILRILILAPVTSVFAFVGSLRSLNLRQPRQWPGTLAAPFLTVPLLHLALSCLWPVFQFRYFVPLMPPIIGLGVFGIYQAVLNPRWRAGILAGSFLLLLAVDGLTFWRVPSHTNYYDSNELYHWRTGEAEWQVDARLLQAAAQNLVDRPPGTVIADAPVFTFTRRPLVRAVNVWEPDDLRFLAARYDVHYILDELDRENLYLESLGGEAVYRNSRYFIIQLK